MDTQQLSGLEIPEKFKDGIFPDPTMMVTIPMKIMAADKGCIEFKTVASDRHLKPVGGVYGGFVATVLDSASGASVHAMLNPGESYGSICMAELEAAG